MLSRAFEGPRWLGFLSRILMTASTPHYWVLKYTHTVSHVNPFVHSMHVFCSVVSDSWPVAPVPNAPLVRAGAVR